MTEPTIPDPSEATPERVDNTRALHRAMVERLVAESGIDVSAVVEQMAADGRICDADVDAAAAKGWVDAKQVGALKANMAKPAPAETVAREHADNV